MARILLIDDDDVFRDFLYEELSELGHDIQWFDCADEALETLAVPGKFDVVLLDNRMPRMSGLELLAWHKERDIRVAVILLTNEHSDQTAIEAINKGATDYVIKPLDFEEVMAELLPALERALEVETSPPPVPLTPRPQDQSQIVGRSKPILDVLKKIGRLSDLDESVLILGETGTGKDLVARAIHTNSKRRKNPFVVMNCTAFNENLLDDELFGHEPGSFTGGEKLRKGRFEHAEGGTLFLDEVGDMPLVLQAKLLRVLENREIVRIGGNDPIRVDVRVVAATHRDLKAMVREGTFRQDLYFRLEGMPIELPPLRERKQDIGLLAEHFLKSMMDQRGGTLLHPKALELLREHPWPGNIRQLKKTLCRAFASCRGSQILPEDLDFGDVPTVEQGSTGCPTTSFEDHLHQLVQQAWQSGQAELWPWLQRQLEAELVRFALQQEGSQLNQVQLAKRLGVARGTLRKWIEQYPLPNSSTK